MTISMHRDPALIDWESLRTELIDDNFHNGRTTDQLRQSFENTAVCVFIMDGSRCVATARALSDGVCNAYVVDVWTHSDYRNHGIATEMMTLIIDACPGQHIYLFTDDAVDFYKRLGFRERPVGLEVISGEWLQNGPVEKLP